MWGIFLCWRGRKNRLDHHSSPARQACCARVACTGALQHFDYDDIKLSSKLLKSLHMLAYATRIGLSAELVGGGRGQVSNSGTNRMQRVPKFAP
jgi:hypothetical protein